MKVVEHTKEDLAWLAGFVDGEGSISIRKASAPSRIRTSHQLFMSITNTNIECLRYIHTKYGGSLYHHDKSIRTNQKASMRWVVRGWEAIRMIELIRPFLKIKQLQADIALEYKKLMFTRYSVPRTESGFLKGRIMRLPDYIWEEREEKRQDLLKANMRGVNANSYN